MVQGFTQSLSTKATEKSGTSVWGRMAKPLPFGQDHAQVSSNSPGGIDLTSVRNKLQTNDLIYFHINQAQLAEYRDVKGFVPVVVGWEPLVNLKDFLTKSL